MEFLSFYNTPSGSEGDKCRYPTRLDTYGCGCAHNCNYCYARSLLDFRGLWHPDNPAAASLKKIEKVLDTIQPGSVIRLGGMTDCFQPIEREKRITYKTLEMMQERGIHSLIVTKSDLIRDYTDVLEKSHIQISVTYTKANPYGENAPGYKERIATIEELYKGGFDVQIRLSPYVPDFIDQDVINNISCDRMIVEFLRVSGFIRKWLDMDFRPYTYKEGSYRHLPLWHKKKILRGFEKEVSICEDVTPHYHYWRQSFNPNPDDCCNLRGLDG